MHHIRTLATLVSAMALATLAGCASQPFVIAPDITQLERAPDAPPRSKATVGYLIPNAYRQSEIKAIGGNGSYFPYRDIEAGYRQLLGNLFEGVFRLGDLDLGQLLRLGFVAKWIVADVKLPERGEPLLALEVLLGGLDQQR